jgi:hypothetical protein
MFTSSNFRNASEYNRTAAASFSFRESRVISGKARKPTNTPPKSARIPSREHFGSRAHNKSLLTAV